MTIGKALSVLHDVITIYGDSSEVERREEAEEAQKVIEAHLLDRGTWNVAKVSPTYEAFLEAIKTVKVENTHHDCETVGCIATHNHTDIFLDIAN